jgi:alkylation response protein AidB-like acyl-CoA dehydrogenase
MPLELTAKTEPGARLVALAERLAEEIAPRAAQHDREASFPFESFNALKRDGYFLAPIPEDLGGLGVASLHDLVVAQSRLARGDAALAIGVNMHLTFVLASVRRSELAQASGNERRARAFASTIEEIAREGTVYEAAVSEPAQDLTRPGTKATRTDEGWTISGRKIFCTMAPGADVFYTSVTLLDGEGRELYGYAMIPRDTPGVVVHDDWDALGMRASGSHSVSFEDVRLPATALRGGFRAGDPRDYMERTLTAGLFHAAAALGVAESADAGVTARLAQREEIDSRSQALAAENVVDLAASRAILSRGADLIDQQHTRTLESQEPGDVTALFAEAQAAKAFIGEATVRTVDRSLALSGGAGYLNGSPLARAYRDARATAFMHPLGANRAFSFLGQLALGREPSLH